MHSQLEDNTKLSALLLKDKVTNQDICIFLDEIWDQYLDHKKLTEKDTSTLKNPYSSIRSKLVNNDRLNISDITTLQEVLQNVNKLFRTYGKKATGFAEFMDNLDTLRKLENNPYSSTA